MSPAERPISDSRPWLLEIRIFNRAAAGKSLSSPAEKSPQPGRADAAKMQKSQNKKCETN
jgi:hypothetical protein